MKKTIIETAEILFQKGIKHYQKELAEEYRKEDPNIKEKYLDVTKYNYIEEWLGENNRHNEIMTRYINEVLLQGKKLVDIKTSYSESGFIIRSENCYITIIYEEK